MAGRSAGAKLRAALAAARGAGEVRERVEARRGGGGDVRRRTPTDGGPGTPQCLKVVGAPSAYTALMASQKGLGCVYLSGGGVALDGLGVPDLGVTTLQDVLEVRSCGSENKQQAPPLDAGRSEGLGALTGLRAGRATDHARLPDAAAGHIS